MPNPDKRDEIRKKAYEIWESEGRPDGRETDHWHDAERAAAEQSAAADKGVETSPAKPAAAKSPAKSKSRRKAVDEK